MSMRALPAIIVSVALVASACSDDSPTASPDTTQPSPGGAVTTPLGTDASGTGQGGSGTSGFVRALTPFADCSAFLDHVKAVARERVGPYGLDGGPNYYLEDDVLVDLEMAADGGDMADEPADEPASAPSPDAGGDDSDSGSGDGSFTGTNVQELGIDEPDIIKTDGDRILVVSENRLSYVDISGSEPELTDQITLDEGWGHELFFLGDRALLFTNGGNWGGPMPVEPMIVDDADNAPTPTPRPNSPKSRCPSMTSTRPSTTVRLRWCTRSTCPTPTTCPSPHRCRSRGSI